MDNDKVIQVKTRKYLSLLLFNAATEFLASARADFAAKRYLTILASHRRFLEYSRRAAWLAYFATDEEVDYAQNNPFAKKPKPFPELQEIDILMRKFVGMNGASGLGVSASDEGATFMQLLHDLTHGGVWSLKALSAGFKVEGIEKVLAQNSRDLRSLGCYVLACNLDYPKAVFKVRLSAVHSEAEQKKLLIQLYKEFNSAVPKVLT